MRMSKSSLKEDKGAQKNRISNTDVQKSNQIVEYDVLKVFAILLAVIGHCTYFVTKTTFGGVDYTQLFTIGVLRSTKALYQVSLLINWIYSFHMPLFFMLSGALYHFGRTRNKYGNFEVLLLKKLKRLIVPYFFCGLLFMIPIKYITRFYTTDNLGNAIFYGLIEGKNNDPGHLWFLAALFWVFLVFYLLEHYVFVLNKYILPAMIIFLILFQYFFSGSPLNFDYVPTYLPYFALGYLFETRRQKFNSYLEKHFILYLCLLAGAATMLYLFYLSDSYDHKNNFLCNILLFGVCISNCLVIYVLSFLLSKWHQFINCRLYKLISKYSLDIYLYHDPLNYVILYSMFVTATITIINKNSGTLVFVLLRTIGVIFVSILIAKFVEKIKSCSLSRPAMAVTKVIICGIIVLAFCNTWINTKRNIKPPYTAFTPTKLESAFIDQNSLK